MATHMPSSLEIAQEAQLRPITEELLAPSRLRAQGVWQPDVVSGWLTQHLDGQVDRGRQLWNLLAAQLWWEEVAA